MKLLILFVGWCILLVPCWPLALLALIRLPVVWMLSLAYHSVRSRDFPHLGGHSCRKKLGCNMAGTEVTLTPALRRRTLPPGTAGVDLLGKHPNFPRKLSKC